MSLVDAATEFLATNIPHIAIVAISCWVAFVYIPKKPKHFPPGPTGLPILGVALSIGKRPEKTFREWSKKYGDIVGFKVGNHYTVVLNSYDVIREAYVKYGTTFGSRPNDIVFGEGLGKQGIVGPDYSADYITERNFAHSVLGKLGFGKAAMEPLILEEAQHLVKSIGNGKIAFDINVRKKVKFSSGNTVARLVFGERFSDAHDPDMAAILEGWQSFFHDGVLALNASYITPWLLHLPEVRKSAQIVRRGLLEPAVIIRKLIKQHKATLDPNNPRDFVDEYLIEQKKNGTDTLYTDETLACMVRDLFGGGLETTELVLIFSFLVLANRPHVLRKVHEEIDSVIGYTGKARYALREKMPYTHAVIKEVMRFRSIGPLLLPHAVHENVKFKGYEIPKDSTIIANVYAVHNSDQHWDKPEVFNPERFINADGKFEASKYLMPFGIGPRTCIGRPLAEVKAFIFFVTLFQHYDVVPFPKSGVERPWVTDDVYRTGLSVHPPGDTSVMLVSRHD